MGVTRMFYKKREIRQTKSKQSLGIFTLLCLSLSFSLVRSFSHLEVRNRQRVAKGVSFGLFNMSPSSTNNESETLMISKIHKFDEGIVKLILASQSPRRREILDMMGMKGRYTVIPSPLDESQVQKELSQKKLDPKDYARTLAERKAEALGDVMMKEEFDGVSTFILGSDTIVDLEGKILEKPTDEDCAIRMIQSLAGVWHKVHTGVALYQINNHGELHLVESLTETANVKFAHLSQEDITAYVKTTEPMDKAGSYGIQGIGGQIVERLEGDFFAVMGLPMHKLSTMLAKAISNL